jgi:hypothetical protein
MAEPHNLRGLATHMKRVVLRLISALMLLAGAGFAGEMQLPEGTFVFSDDDDYFGRMTVTAEGAFTGTLRDTEDEFEFGKRTFRGQLSFGGEVDCELHYPQATYYHPFGPSEFLSIRHTPDGPTEYLLIVKLVGYNRIGPPTVYTYELPAYRVLEDPSAAGIYTLLLRAAPSAIVGAAPGGTGWAVMRLSAEGRFRCLGRLANNEAFSFGFDARADRKLDLFRFQSPSTYYPRKGGTFHTTFYGTIMLRDVADVSDADGTVKWSNDISSEGEFITDLPVIGSRYVPTRDALSLFTSGIAPGTEPPGGLATFTHRTFPEPRSAGFRFGTQPVVLADSRRLMPALSWVTDGNAFPGRFRGIVRPNLRQTRPFSGVFFGKQQMAEGFFRLWGDSGVVRLGIEAH